MHVKNVDCVGSLLHQIQGYKKEMRNTVLWWFHHAVYTQVQDCDKTEKEMRVYRKG